MGRARSSTLVNRNVTIGGRRTSLRLEPPMWEALQEIALREGISAHELCSEVEADRQESTLTAAIRVHILNYFRAAATEQGHSLAGHGQRGVAVGLAGGGMLSAVPDDGRAAGRAPGAGEARPPVAGRGCPRRADRIGRCGKMPRLL